MAAWGVHDHGNAGQANQRADHIPAVGSEPIQGQAPASEPATNTPP